MVWRWNILGCGAGAVGCLMGCDFWVSLAKIACCRAHSIRFSRCAVCRDGFAVRWVVLCIVFVWVGLA